MMFSSRIFTCFVLVTITLSVNQINANDTQNLNRLLNNQVIVSRQIMCVLEKSPCDQLGRQLKGKFEGCVCVVSFKLFLLYMNGLKSLVISLRTLLPSFIWCSKILERVVLLSFYPGEIQREFQLILCWKIRRKIKQNKHKNI